MGKVLSDGLIQMLNNCMPAAQVAELGTKLDDALGGVVPSGSIETGELADGILSADAAGRLKMANSFVTTEKEVVTPFHGVATLTAAAAGTAVPIIADADVPAGKKIYVTGYRVIVNGATAWTDATATKVSIQDSNSSPVLVVDIAKAGLTGNAIINTVGGTNQTLGANIVAGTGLTAAKGLVIKGDANFGAGSDIKVAVFGVIK